MVSADLVGCGVILALLVALAVLVKFEWRLSRWLAKSPPASQEKSGGPQEARASVSLGSAGAGEKMLRTISRSLVACQK